MPQYCVTLYIHCLSCLKIMSSFATSRNADFANLLLHVCFSLCGSAWKKDIHRNHFLVWRHCLSRPLNMCVQCRLLHLSLTCYKKRKTAEDRVSTSLTLRQIWGAGRWSFICPYPLGIGWWFWVIYPRGRSSCYLFGGQQVIGCGRSPCMQHEVIHTGVEVWFQLFLTSAYMGLSSPSHLGCFTPGERTLEFPLIVHWIHRPTLCRHALSWIQWRWE